MVVARNIDADGDVDAGSDDLGDIPGQSGHQRSQILFSYKAHCDPEETVLHCDPEDTFLHSEEAADMIETYKFEALLLRDPEWQQIYSIIIKNKKYKW